MSISACGQVSCSSLRSQRALRLLRGWFNLFTSRPWLTPWAAFLRRGTALFAKSKSPVAKNAKIVGHRAGRTNASALHTFYILTAYV